MLRKLLKNKKAQNTAEYAILISLVVAGIIAMQTYAQRALQAKVRDAASYMKNEIVAADPDFGSTTQYEPYYLTTDYDITRNEATTKKMGKAIDSVRQDASLIRKRAAGGFQNMSINPSSPRFR